MGDQKKRQCNEKEAKEKRHEFSSPSIPLLAGDTINCNSQHDA